MLEGLELIISLLGDVSAYAAYVLGGYIIAQFLLYVFTGVSIVYVIKLVCDRLFSWLTGKGPAIKVTQLNCSHTSLKIYAQYTDQLLNLLNEELVGLLNSHMHHISDRDIDWLAEAIKEKKERDDD